MPHTYDEMPNDIDELLSALKHINTIVALKSPELHNVLGDAFFSDMLHALQTTMKEGKIQFNDLTNFRCFFMRILQAHPGAAFCATNSLATSHLWNERGMKEALKVFIRDGGTIEQIFFVKSLEEIASSAVETILDSLQEIGIKMSIASNEQIPAGCERLFLVESTGKVAWELLVDDQGHMGFVITTDQQATANYCQIFDQLKQQAQQLKLSYRP